MALIKTLTTDTGISGEYWQIFHLDYSKDNAKTAALVRCYASKTIRGNGLDKYIHSQEFQKMVEYDGELSVEDIYAKMKISVMSPAVGTEGQDGYVAPAETNWFADSTDDL